MRRRKEAEAALDKIREIAKAETGPDWSEAEWKRVMAAAVAQRIEGVPIAPRPKLKPAFAYGIASILAVAVIGLILWNTVLKRKESPLAPPPVLVQKVPAPETIPPQSPDKKKDIAVQPDDRPIVVARAAKPRMPETRSKEPAAAGTEGSQDVVSVTLFSQDSGLKVIWFLDKNFEWKGSDK